MIILKKNNTFKFIAGVSKKEGIRLFAVTVMMAISSFMGVYLALVMRRVINSATSGDYKEMKLWGAALIAVVVVEIFLYVATRILAAQMSAKLEIAFREVVFSKLLKKEYSSVSAFHSGEIQNRLFSDVTVVSENVSTLLPNLVGLVTRLLSALVAVFVVDSVFALIILSAGVFMFIFARLLKGVMKKSHKEAQEAGGEVRAHTQEAVENLLVIKAFEMETKIEENEKRHHLSYYKKKMKRALFSIAATGGVSALVNFGYAYAVIWGAAKIISGVSGFGYGDFVAIMQLIGQIQTPFASLSGSLSRYYATIASAERLIEICDLPEELQETSDTEEIYEKLSSIVLCDVSFSYGENNVLETAAAEIEKNKLTLISGISGIGKSTLIKLLMGVIAPQSGEVFAKTTDGKKALDATTRGLFAYVPQGNLLMSGTVAENLRLAKADATEEEMLASLSVACADFVSELPDGLETMLGERGSGLSEGQVQRLAIARAVLFGAPVFLLDEATSALDEMTEKKVLENIMKLSGKTCVCISHRNAAREICDKEIYIENGKVFERK